jgi:signal transduction histidine kinase
MEYEAAEVEQLRLKDILRPDQLVNCGPIFTNWIGDKEWSPITTVFITKSGQEVHIEGTIVAQQDNGRFTSALGIFRDVTPRIQAEQQLLNSLKRTDALYRIAQAQSSYQNLPHLLQVVTESVAEVLPANRVIIYTFDADKRKVVHFATGGPGAGNVIRYTFQEVMDGLPGWVLRNQEPALAFKDEPDPRVSSLIFERRAELNIGSIIVVPVHYQNQIMGTLIAMNSYSEPDFSEDDQDLMVAISNQVALALENIRLYEAEQRRTRELQAQNEELDAFAHTVAHDLKSPLGNLMGFAEMLAVDIAEVDSSLQKQADYIFQSGRKMVNIIDELMVLSQVRKADVEVEVVDMGPIVMEALERLTDLVQQHKAQITQPDNWPTAVGYDTWIEEIWLNYISNAIKYGGQPPQVSLSYQQLADGMIRFEVRDNGAGLTADQQGRLFRPFERLEQLGKIEGHGLGLSIVRRIAEKLGGQVGVESEGDGGSTFYFTLPAAES